MRSSCGRWRWSIIRTVGGSIQTVFRSRVSPSHWTRTGSPAKGPDEPVQGRGLHVPFHVPGEGVVVHRLLVDLRELLDQTELLALRITQGGLDLASPEAPAHEVRGGWGVGFHGF